MMAASVVSYACREYIRFKLWACVMFVCSVHWVAHTVVSYVHLAVSLLYLSGHATNLIFIATIYDSPEASEDVSLEFHIFC